jgi:hypothetical protein
MIRSRLLPAASLLALLMAAEASAAPPIPPTPVEAADLSEAYRDKPQVEHARRVGLDSTTLASLSDPELPADLRVAIVHAAETRRPANKSHAQVFARHLTAQLGKERMTLARLSVPDLLTLGYMTALESPKTLQRKGGASEVERASAAVLLTAAVNRNRGDLSIALIDALLKAQIAVTTPELKLCEPDACVDQVLANYPEEWSMRPAAVCALVAAIPRTDAAGAGARMCAALKNNDAHAPVYAEGGVSPADSMPQGAQAGRFSQPTPASPWANMGGMMGGGALPPGQDPVAMMRAMLPPPSTPEEALIYDMLLQELEAQTQQLQAAGIPLSAAFPPGMFPPGMFPNGMNPQAAPAPVASPSTIQLAPDAPDSPDAIPVDAGQGLSPAGSIPVDAGNTPAASGGIIID